jgi:hypothetical protein
VELLSKFLRYLIRFLSLVPKVLGEIVIEVSEVLVELLTEVSEVLRNILLRFLRYLM